jgi:hypothetical protein
VRSSGAPMSLLPFPKDDAIQRLICVLLLKQNDEWPEPPAATMAGAAPPLPGHKPQVGYELAGRTRGTI